MTAARRTFLKTAAAGAAVGAAAGPVTAALARDHHEEGGKAGEKKQPVIGCIGTGSRWNAVGMQAAQFGRVKTVCDADARRMDKAAKMIAEAHGYEPAKNKNYRAIIEDPEVDVVVIATTDHWHAKPLIEAVRAGKDAYCEKPLTLTIAEGRAVCDAVKETGRVVQVGTQQRTEMGRKFLTALALVREGRLGDVEKITCGINRAPTSPGIPVVGVPDGLDWDLWLGPAPEAEFRRDGKFTNGHYEFRWWYEYSGGKMTDWGAHHVDIAQWVLDRNGPGQGPTRIVPDMDAVMHPAYMDEDGMPVKKDRYNVAHSFRVSAFFDGGAEIVIDSEGRNGLLIEGTDGRIFVSRGDLTGAPVEDLTNNPLPADAIKKVYKNQDIPDGPAHMRNFFDAREGKGEVISDVFSHHRALTTCHLANIAIRLGRELTWDPKAEQIVGDEQAQAMTGRPYREGYEIVG